MLHANHFLIFPRLPLFFIFSFLYLQFCCLSIVFVPIRQFLSRKVVFLNCGKLSVVESRVNFFFDLRKDICRFIARISVPKHPIMFVQLHIYTCMICTTFAHLISRLSKKFFWRVHLDHVPTPGQFWFIQVPLG